MHCLLLCSAYDYVVPARGKQVVLTDIQVELPEGCYGRIAPRSGLAAKSFINVGGEFRYLPEAPSCELLTFILPHSWCRGRGLSREHRRGSVQPFRSRLHGDQRRSHRSVYLRKDFLSNSRGGGYPDGNWTRRGRIWVHRNKLNTASNSWLSISFNTYHH